MADVVPASGHLHRQVRERFAVAVKWLTCPFFSPPLERC